MLKEREVYSFCGENCILPLEILQKAEGELLNYKNSGIGVMEMSHRSREYANINNKTNDDLRQLLNVPQNYKILLMQGGASLQYSAIPMNILKNNGFSNQLVGGFASNNAAEESKKQGNTNIVAPIQENYHQLPPVQTWNINKKADYFYYTDNETVEGLEFKNIPQGLDVELILVGDMTLVSDMTSSLGTKQIDVSKFGVIFASAQKNLGPTGVTVVIVRDDLIGIEQAFTPNMFSWKTTLDNLSIFNTAPCFAVYMTGMFVDYMNKTGGVPYYQSLSEQRSKLIYDVIDSSHGFYRGNVTNKADRSRINALLYINDNDTQLQDKFVKEASENGLVELRGHQSTGGLRISMFNGMPLQGIKKLKDFMSDFIDKNQ